MCEERTSIGAILDDAYDLGYDSIDRAEEFPHGASGQVPLPENHRGEPPEGLGAFSRVYTVTQAIQILFLVLSVRLLKCTVGLPKQWAGMARQ